jgi:transcriptional regulator of acetoin/glycerol metabolism
MRTTAIVSNTAEAWRKYVSVGAIASGLLRPHVLRGWARSHDQGASPWVTRAEMLSPGETDRMRDDHARLLSAARPYLQLLAQAAGNERHAAVLGTAGALVLDVIGDEQSVSGPERVPGPGSLLSEAMCGANGVGTPLAEGHYIELIATEHFTHGFHPFTCHGIPIETPGGEREGVLSVSVQRPETAERQHEILVCAAYGIATQLVRLRLADAVRDIMAAGEHASLEALRAALVRLGAMRPEESQRGAEPAESMRRATTRLLRLASDSMSGLERRERAWRELSSDAPGIPSQIALEAEVSDLVELLQPEAKRRHIEVTYGSALEPLTGLADRQKLRRDIFRLLLRGINAAEGGGAIIIHIEKDSSGHIEKDSSGALCYTRVEAVPGPERPGERTSSSVVCPRAPSPDR